MLKTIHTKLFFVLLLLLPSQLNYFFWPPEASVLGRRIDYLAPSIYFVDILIIIILVLWLMNNRRQLMHYIQRHALPLLLLGLLIISNCFISQRPGIALYHWLMWIKFGLVGLYVYTNNFHKRLLTIFCLTVGILWTSLLGNWQIVQSGSIGGIFYFVGERTFSLDTPNIAKAVFCPVNTKWNVCFTTLRMYGTFPHPNVLAGYIVFVLLLLRQHKDRLLVTLTSFLDLLLHKRSQSTQKIRNLLWWVLIIYLSLSLVLTFSRTAVVALFVGMLWFTDRISTLHKRLLTMLVIAAILLITLPYSPLTLLSRDTESIFTRQQLNHAALSIIVDSPVLGLGLSHFLISLPLYLSSRTIYFLQPVHNIYLLLISEIGFFGIAVLFISFVLFFRKLHISLETGLIIPFLIIGLTDHYLMTLHHGQLLLLFIMLYGLKTHSPTASSVFR